MIGTAIALRRLVKIKCLAFWDKLLYNFVLRSFIAINLEELLPVLWQYFMLVMIGFGT